MGDVSHWSRPACSAMRSPGRVLGQSHGERCLSPSVARMSRWEVAKKILLALAISAGMIGVPVLAWTLALTR